MNQNRLPMRSLRDRLTFLTPRNNFENIFIDSVLPIIHEKYQLNGISIIEAAQSEFNNLVGDAHVEEAMQAVRSLILAGVSRSDIYTYLFTPLMVETGKLWDKDELSFYEAGHRIEVLLHLLNEMDSFDFVTGTRKNKTVLTISLQNDGHTFGLSVVAQMYRDAGWQVDAQQVTSCNQLVRYLERNYYSLVGISVTSEACAFGLDDIVWSIRNYSCNRDVKIILGGFLVTKNSKAFECFGADAIAVDGVQAIGLSERLILPHSENIDALSVVGAS